jgi:hypothetical protein
MESNCPPKFPARTPAAASCACPASEREARIRDPLCERTWALAEASGSTVLTAAGAPSRHTTFPGGVSTPPSLWPVKISRGMRGCTTAEDEDDDDAELLLAEEEDEDAEVAEELATVLAIATFKSRAVWALFATHFARVTVAALCASPAGIDRSAEGPATPPPLTEALAAFVMAARSKGKWAPCPTNA